MSILTKILLVEDDPLLGEGLLISLNLEGHTAVWEKTVKSAWEAYQTQDFDLVILDIGLPDGKGTELCQQIRSENNKIGILFLTAKTDEETVVRGLELGANDFVKKPFSQKELMARIKVILRPKLLSDKELKGGGVTLSPERRTATFKEQTLSLNRRQFDILSFFMSHPDQIVTRDQLLNHLNTDGDVIDRTIDSHVSQLRKILKSNHVNSLNIASIYGIGYRLENLE